MSLYDSMNRYLANQMVMYVKLHNMHWYIEGEAFFTLHAKFEELYDKTAQIMDEVAERMLALGMKPVANVKQALAITSVEELENQPITLKDAMHHMVTDVEYWVRDTAELIRLAEGDRDCVTADLFMGYLKEYQKLQWMLKAYCK